MKTKYVLIPLLTILVGASAAKGVMAIKEHHDSVERYQAQFPPTIIKINPEISVDDADDIEYPSLITIKYSLPYNSPLINNGYVYGFTGSADDYWHVTVLKKEKGEYIIKKGNDDYKNFVVKKPQEFGFKGYAEFKDTSGSFEVKFEDEKSFTDFVLELDDNNEEWEKPYLYMKKVHSGEVKK